MGMLCALAVGYFLGAKSGGDELDQLMNSLRALTDSDEFADVVTAARSHLAYSLREVATMLDGAPTHSGGAQNGGDLVDRVRHLFGNE